MKTLKKIFLASCVLVLIIGIIGIFGIIQTVLHDRQLYGQYRRLLAKTPNTDFKHKYETPYFRQYNLNTRTDKLGVCSWLKGKDVRVIARSCNNSFYTKRLKLPMYYSKIELVKSYHLYTFLFTADPVPLYLPDEDDDFEQFIITWINESNITYSLMNGALIGTRRNLVVHYDSSVKQSIY